MTRATSFAPLVAKRVRFRAWYALGFTLFQRVPLALVGPTLLAGALRGHPELKHGKTGSVIALGFIAVTILSVIVPDKLIRWLRIRWVDKLPLPLDRESYAAALDGIGRHASLRVVVTGSRLATVDLAGVPGTVTTSADTWTFESPPLFVGTADMIPNAGHNLKLHRWFKQLASRVLVPSGQRDQFTRIVVEHVPQK
jgi:hypothetical protein